MWFGLGWLGSTNMDPCPSLDYRVTTGTPLFVSGLSAWYSGDVVISRGRVHSTYRQVRRVRCNQLDTKTREAPRRRQFVGMGRPRSRRSKPPYSDVLGPISVIGNGTLCEPSILGSEIDS